jgi:SAM-dependent methyltransferase
MRKLLLDLRLRRSLPRLRRLVQLGLVRWDTLLHGRDPAVKQWLPVLTNARTGHIVLPTKALASSRSQAMDFVRRRLVEPGFRVLDIGAGNGRLAIGLLEAGIGEYVGLEVDRGSVDFANEVFKPFGPVHFDFLDLANPMYNPGGSMKPDEVTYPYPDESFDFIIASSLYTHLERLTVVERNLSESARVLRPGRGAFASFFRSPPNGVSSSAVRSVFREQDIRDLIAKCFTIEDELNGRTTAFHDQWTIYLRRK